MKNGFCRVSGKNGISFIVSLQLNDENQEILNHRMLIYGRTVGGE